MTTEGFKITLLNHCRDEIREIFYESRHFGLFDAKSFSEKLENIWNEARLNAVEESEFKQIVNEVIFEHSDDIIYPFAA